jgi:hypothetical protein
LCVLTGGARGGREDQIFLITCYMSYVLREGGEGKQSFICFFSIFLKAFVRHSNSEMEHKPLSIKSVFQLNFHKLRNLELR